MKFARYFNNLTDTYVMYQKYKKYTVMSIHKVIIVD